MATTEERMKILKMIQEGKITADEGAKLLSALSKSSKKSVPRRTRQTTSGRFLRVRVTDMAAGKAKVNVVLPLKLIDAGMNIAAQFAPDMGIDNLMSAVSEAITDNLTGKIVDVIDEEDGEHIEIFID